VTPRRFAEPGPKFRPDLLPVPEPPAPDEGRLGTPLAEAGEGCGDIVLFVAAHRARELRDGVASVYITGHPPPLKSGGRVYVHDGEAIAAWRPVRRVRVLPNGHRIEFEPGWHPVAVAHEVKRPVSAVARGAHGEQQWIWRSWPRAAE
jgi:hypothetical protein